MLSLESVFPEEWRLSNVLSSSDLYADELHGKHIIDGDGVGSELWKPVLSNQLDEANDSGIGLDLDSFPWLEEASTCITHLDASLQLSSLPQIDDPVADVLADLESMEASVSYDVHSDLLVPDTMTTPVGSFEEKSNLPSRSGGWEVLAPSSPVERSTMDQAPVVKYEMAREQSPVVKYGMAQKTPVVKYVEPSSIDTRSLTSSLTSAAQIVISDLNVLHLPEPHDDQAGLLLIEAMSDPALTMELAVDEVESVLSTPPSSPEALVPTSSPDEDDDYTPSRKRKSTSGLSPKSLKSMKPSEKKERKKLQNKNAATKYRHKKRAQDHQIKEEATELQSDNAQLRRKIEDLSTEIKYMKALVNEVLKSKGLKIK